MFEHIVKPISLLALLYFLKAFVSAIFHAYHGPLSKIPGPFWNKFTNIAWMITSLRGKGHSDGYEIHMKYGDVVRLGPSGISVRDPDTFRKIIQEWDLPKSPGYERFKPDDEINTLFTERDKVIYRHKRRLLSPGFSISYLNAQEPLMHEGCNALREVMDEACQKAPNGEAVMDICNLLADLGIDIITASAFGGSLNLVRNKNHVLRSLTTQFFKWQSIYGMLGFLKRLPGAKEHRRGPKLYAILDEILQRRLALEEKDQKKDLLQIFLDAHEEDPKGYTFEHVKAEMLLFLLAGSETTASTVAFSLLLLVHDDRARKLLMKELDEAFPNKDDAITTDKTKHLSYLHAVIYESLRLMPPTANGFARITDRTLIFNGYTVPAETMVTANVYALQHDPNVWGSDVETFRPDRFIEPGGEKLLKSSMFPFSAGSRSCIGKNFAMMELQIILATLVRHYDISLVLNQDLELLSRFVLALKSGQYRVRVKQRE